MRNVIERASCDELLRVFRTGVAAPKSPIPALQAILSILLHEMRLHPAVQLCSLGSLGSVFERRKLNATQFAFRCNDDLGACFRSVFGNLLASPLYAQHGSWAWELAREASGAWMREVVGRFGALGSFLADNLAACLYHELLFTQTGAAVGTGIARRWRNPFLAGNFPGGIFRRGTFLVFVA